MTKSEKLKALTDALQELGERGNGVVLAREDTDAISAELLKAEGAVARLQEALSEGATGLMASIAALERAANTYASVLNEEPTDA